MSDQITQKLGFDASGAIASVASANKSFATMNARLNAIDTAATRFNTSGAELATVLKSVGTSGTSAAVGINRLYSAMSNASQIAKATGSAVGGLSSKLGVANQSAGALRGNLNNLAVAGGRAAAGINKIGPGNLANVTTQTNAAAAAMANWNAQVKAAKQPNVKPPRFNPGGNQGGGQLFSGQTLVRAGEVALLYKSVAEITTALRFAGESAVEFSAKVAEIRTISTVKDLGVLKQQVADLASEFNRPLTDVAEGYYQTLSNQVGDAAESAKFLATALKFGKVAVTETGDSVNLLAGAIHAFNRPTEEAGDIAAKFFKTIELGRIRGSELASVYGRVATVAHQLGISSSELDAAFVTMTNKGVKASEAATQISGAMTALIKPSRDGAAAIRKLGFDSGEALIEAYSFQGALQRLIDTTDGSTTAVSKLVPRVRGLSFVLAATGESANFYKDSLEKIKATSDEGLNTEFLRQMSTDAEKVTAELNRLRIFLTKDLGDALLSAASGALQMTGGAENLSLALKHLAPLLELGGAAAALAGGYYAATTIKTFAFAEATTALGGAFKFAFGWAGVALAAYEAYEFAVDHFAKVEEKRVQDILDGEERINEALRKAAAARIRTQEEEIRNVQALLAQRNAAFTQGYDQELAAAKTANDNLVSQSKDLYKELLRAYEDYLGQLRHKIDEKKRLEETVVERIDEARRKKADDEFEHDLRDKPDVEKAKAYGSKAVTSSAEAAALRSKANPTEAELKAADRKDREAEGYLDKAKGVVKHEDHLVEHDDNKVAAKRRKLWRAEEGLDDFDQQAALVEQGRQEKLESRTQRAAQRKEKLAAQNQFNVLRRKNPQVKFAGGQFVGGDDATRAQLEQFRRNKKLRGVAQDQDDLHEAVGDARQARQDADAGNAVVGDAEKRVRANQAGGNAAQLTNLRKDSAELEAGLNKTRETYEHLKQLVDTVNQNISETDKKGNLLPSDERAKRAKKASGAATEILELTVDSKDEALNKYVEGLKSAIAKRLTDEQIQHIRLVPDNVLGIHAQVQKIFADKPIKMKVEIDFAGSGGRRIIKDNGEIDTAEFREGTKEQTERLEKLRRDQSQAGPLKVEDKQATESVARLVSETDPSAVPHHWWDTNNGAADEYGKKGRGLLHGHQKEYANLRGIIQRAAQSRVPLSKEGVEQLANRLKGLANYDEFGTDAKTFETSANYNKLDQAIKQLEKARSAREKLDGNEAIKPAGKKELEKLEEQQAQRNKVALTVRDDAAEKARLAKIALKATEAELDSDDEAYVADYGVHGQKFHDAVVEYNKKPHTKEENQQEGARRHRYNQRGSALKSLFDRYQAQQKEAEEAEKAAKAAAELAGNVAQADGPMARVAQLAQLTANGYERAAQASRTIQIPKAPDALRDPNDVVAAHGGTIRRFASGGGIGTDTVPAMLSPGEFVWNAQTARNFFPQLTALNAGSRPPASYPSSSVTNVGDVNITVPGGPNTSGLARKLGNEFKREIRRRRG
jgi:TP901 family phage tail tape measure protein